MKKMLSVVLCACISLGGCAAHGAASWGPSVSFETADMSYERASDPGVAKPSGVFEPADSIGCCSASTPVASSYDERVTGLGSEPVEYDFDMALENGDVVWSHEGVHNLSKLDEFIDRIGPVRKHAVRVVTSSKEGEMIIKDVVGCGEDIVVTTYREPPFYAIPGNGGDRLVATDRQHRQDDHIETAAYDRIHMTSRFHEHYNGFFIEYWLVNDREGRNDHLLQILQSELGKE